MLHVCFSFLLLGGRGKLGHGDVATQKVPKIIDGLSSKVVIDVVFSTDFVQ